MWLIASTIGRASNLVMSICSTGVESSSALRVSLTVERSISSSVVISCSKCRLFPDEGRGPGFFVLGWAPAYAGVRAISKFHDVRSRCRLCTIEAGHRLVLDHYRIDRPEAVELGAHCASIGAEHPDLDII